jgi:hypothetical protein
VAAEQERHGQGNGIAHATQERRPTRGREVAQVRGVLADRVVISTELDPFLDLRALSAYSSLSVRKLRDLLEEPGHPLPCYQVGGKLLVRRSEFDNWVNAYRRRGRADVDEIVTDVFRDLAPRRVR